MTTPSRTPQARRPRRLALGLGALLLAAPLLGACGFDYATDRVNTIEAGTNDRGGPLKLLGAVVVSAQPGSGTFVANLVNSNEEESALTGIDGALSGVSAPDFDPISIPARGHTSLSQDGGVVLTGDLTPGQFLTLTFTFDGGGETSLDVPVVVACRQWEGLDESADSLADTASASASASASPSASAEAGSGDASASPSAAAEPAEPYDCEPATSGGE